MVGAGNSKKHLIVECSRKITLKESSAKIGNGYSHRRRNFSLGQERQPLRKVRLNLKRRVRNKPNKEQQRTKKLAFIAGHIEFNCGWNSSQFSVTDALLNQ